MYKLDIDDTCNFNGQTLYRLVAITDGLLYKKGDKGGYASEDVTIVDSFISESSKIVGKVTVRTSIIMENVLILSKAFNKTINRSVIKSSRIEDSNIIKSSIFDSYIEGAYVTFTSVWGASIKDTSISTSLVECCNTYWLEAFKACLSDDKDCGVFCKVGSEDGNLSWYKTGNKGEVYIKRGCFQGSLEEFEAAVKGHHGDSKIGKEYKLLIDFIKLRASNATL